MMSKRQLQKISRICLQNELYEKAKDEKKLSWTKGIKKEYEYLSEGEELTLEECEKIKEHTIKCNIESTILGEKEAEILEKISLN